MCSLRGAEVSLCTFLYLQAIIVRTTFDSTVPVMTDSKLLQPMFLTQGTRNVEGVAIPGFVSSGQTSKSLEGSEPWMISILIFQDLSMLILIKTILIRTYCYYEI